MAQCLPICSEIKGLEVLLSRHEEAALRKIGFGLIDAAEP